MAEKKILVRQTRSGIRTPKNQKETLIALGLGKIGQTAVHTRTDSLMGRLRTVSHLVQAKEVSE